MALRGLSPQTSVYDPWGIGVSPPTQRTQGGAGPRKLGHQSFTRNFWQFAPEPSPAMSTLAPSAGPLLSLGGGAACRDHPN